MRNSLHVMAVASSLFVTNCNEYDVHLPERPTSCGVKLCLQKRDPGGTTVTTNDEDNCFGWISIDSFKFHRFVACLLHVLFSPSGLVRDAGCKHAERQAAAVGYRDILKIAT